MARFNKQTGEVAIPRFTLEYQTSLTDPLTGLGMGTVFDPSKADFHPLTDTANDMPVYLTEFIHKTFLKVNEEGTEAAAVTAMVTGMISLEPEPFQMVVDRPFFLAIRDASGVVLFMGIVTDPEEV